MSSSTPSRYGAARPAPGGNYADPYSPIASTPQKQQPGKTPGKPAQTPSMAALSPMKQPNERPLQRHGHDASEATPEGTWTNGIFSPGLKYYGTEEEEQQQRALAGGGYSPSSAPRGSSTPSSISNLSQRVAAVSVSDGVHGGSLTQLASPGGRVSMGTSPTAGSAHHSGMAGTPSRSSAAVAAAAAAHAAAQAQAAALAAAAQAAAAQHAARASSQQQAEEEFEYEEFNPYLFIKLLPPYHTVAPRIPRLVMPSKRRASPDINLVLDLDETLVHCSVDPIPDADVTFPVVFNGANYQVYVRKRPFLDKFFASIAGKFEVTVFTASQQVYAEKLLNLLDPEGVHIHYRLYRDSCLNVEGNYLKDLNVLGRDMSKTVLVDNSPHAFGYQIENGIPIESWFEDPKDTELMKLSAFLHTLLGCQDVRPLVRDKFQVHKLVEDAQLPTR